MRNFGSELFIQSLRKNLVFFLQVYTSGEAWQVGRLVLGVVGKSGWGSKVSHNNTHSSMQPIQGGKVAFPPLFLFFAGFEKAILLCFLC